jgi:hypothetical protein
MLREGDCRNIWNKRSHGRASYGIYLMPGSKQGEEGMTRDGRGSEVPTTARPTGII